MTTLRPYYDDIDDDDMYSEQQWHRMTFGFAFAPLLSTLVCVLSIWVSLLEPYTPPIKILIGFLISLACFGLTLALCELKNGYNEHQRVKMHRRRKNRPTGWFLYLRDFNQGYWTFLKCLAVCALIAGIGFGVVELIMFVLEKFMALLDALFTYHPKT